MRLLCVGMARIYRNRLKWNYLRILEIFSEFFTTFLKFGSTFEDLGKNKIDS